MNKKELLDSTPKLAKLSKAYSNIDITILGIDSSPFLTRIYERGFADFFPCLDEYINSLVDTKEQIENFDYIMTTGKLINHLLRINHITSAELSKAIGVAPSSVSRWLSGSTRITEDNLLKLSKYFDVSLEYLKGDHCMKNHKQEARNKEALKNAINFITSYRINDLDKEILKECGYYPIDIYINSEYYDCKPLTKLIYENQQINENSWIMWRYEIKYFPRFPQKILLVSIEDLEKMGFPYWSIKEHIGYSEEIKNIAQYVDYDKLKVLIEDRKNLLSFNFEKSLESIK